MALYIYNPGCQPLGQFDFLDSYLTTYGVNGGEAGTLTTAARYLTSTEKASSDTYDGYENSSTLKRPAVMNCINATSTRPIWLLDEGTTGYGTLFGQVIGSPAGLSTTSTNLGPHTMAGSGKVTCWDKPGLYAISTDAVDARSGGFIFSNASVTVGCVVDVVKQGVGHGRLTPAGGTNAVGVTIGNFVEFEVSPFLVNTPPSLVGATQTPTRVVIYFNVYDKSA